MQSGRSEEGSKSLAAANPHRTGHLISLPHPTFSTTGRRRSQAGMGRATAPPRLHLHRALHPPAPPYTTIHPLHHHLAPLHHPSAPPLHHHHLRARPDEVSDPPRASNCSSSLASLLLLLFSKSSCCCSASPHELATAPLLPMNLLLLYFLMPLLHL